MDTPRSEFLNRPPQTLNVPNVQSIDRTGEMRKQVLRIGRRRETSLKEILEDDTMQNLSKDTAEILRVTKELVNEGSLPASFGGEDCACT